MSMDNGSQSSPTGGDAADGAEFMLFGVRVRVDPMRKSVSLNDLSQYELPPQDSSKVAAGGDGIAGGGGGGGYASADDAVQQQPAGSRERKRGVPWTEEEHKLFLLGLEKVGKGDWRGISRNFVKTRTPTQVASHAQKYFLRRSNINRRRRRSSLFDITTESVSAIPMEEKVHQEHKAQPLLSPARLPLAETSLICGPRVFPVTMSPISVPVHIDNSMEKFTFRHLGPINSAGVVHQVPVLPVPIQTRIVDLNLNQGLSEDRSSLSLNLSLALDQVQDEFSRQSAFEGMSSFSNGESMISVA